MPPDLVIFDCDGVLIDSQLIQCRVDTSLLNALGYPISAAEMARDFIGASTDALIRHVEADLGRALPADFEQQRDACVDDAYRRELQAVEGVAAAVAALSQPNCVASNAQTTRVRDALALAGLLSLFEPHVYGADLVAQPKPSPDLFLFCAERMGVAPGACLVIEDSVAGVSAAVAAGMMVYGFHGGEHCRDGYEKSLLAAGAAEVFDHMDDLHDLTMLQGGRARR